ncbi:MAG: cyclodeaminase/cyclohydrolase family protein [Firmicutes bacterium]|nr:cyclodeaminase/cyclohydrolase family protein [Bacillota bacterium]
MTEAQVSYAAFVDKLASSAPTPGGGGASALVGAVGVALGHMVGSLTVGKPKYAQYEEELHRLMADAQRLQAQLLELIDADAAAFAPLAAAYGLPKNTPEEQQHKAEVMAQVLKDAAAVPLAIMQACAEAIRLHERFAACGSALVISDVGCGVICCKAALQAASLNVFINTKAMADREYAAALEKEAQALLDASLPLADEIFRNVEGRFR